MVLMPLHRGKTGTACQADSGTQRGRHAGTHYTDNVQTCACAGSPGLRYVRCPRLLMRTTGLQR